MTVGPARPPGTAGVAPGGRGWLAGPLLLLVTTSCSLLAEPGPARLACVWPVADAGTDPCPGALRCVAGACAPCDPDGPEVCANGKDDDCDARVDEGSDVDGDGFATCARTADGPIDCDDVVATAHPGGVETCDGRDGDCDGRVDEAAAGEPPLCLDPIEECERRLCRRGDDCRETPCDPTDEICVPGDGGFRCVPGTPCVPMDEGPTSCPPETPVCDPDDTGVCLAPASLGPGAPCTADLECDEGAGGCLEGAILPSLPGPIPFARCLAACAADADCPPGSVCWSDPGTGARACFDAARAGLELGEGASGAPCGGEDDPLCRSGVCAAPATPGEPAGDGRCVGRCARSADCPAEQVCRHAASAGEGVVGRCVAPDQDALLEAGSPCAGDDEACASGVCLRLGLGDSRCSALCAVPDDCPGGSRCALVDRRASGAGQVGVCVPGPGDPLASAGDPCQSDPECWSGGCLDGVCARRCARSGDCRDDRSCQPVPAGGGWPAFCAEP